MFNLGTVIHAFKRKAKKSRGNMEEALGALELEFKRVAGDLEFVSHRLESESSSNSKVRNDMFIGLFIYTDEVIFHVYWCTTKPRRLRSITCSILYSIEEAIALYGCCINEH